MRELLNTLNLMMTFGFPTSIGRWGFQDQGGCTFPPSQSWVGASNNSTVCKYLLQDSTASGAALLARWPACRRPARITSTYDMCVYIYIYTLSLALHHAITVSSIIIISSSTLILSLSLYLSLYIYIYLHTL